MEYTPTKCVICQKPSQGVHFGVETCRACAMFFRRSKLINDWQCKRRKDYCSLEAVEERLMCKFCRLQKCLEMGMNDKKQKPLTPIRNRYHQRVIYDVFDPVTQKTSRLIDLAPIIKRSLDILEKHKLPENVQNLNSLEKMAFSLGKLRSNQDFQPKMVNSLSFRDFFWFWERNMVRCAEWLMYSEEFRKLPLHERIEIFKLVWAVWRKIERNTMSAEVFGQKCYSDKILLLSDKIACRVNHFSMDVSEFWKADFKTISSFFGSNNLNYYESLVKPYLDLQLTPTEVNFILCQIIWNYAGRKLNGQTQKAADVFLERISNDLNDFYHKNLRNYAPRLARIMQIVNQILVLQSKQEKIMDMILLFDYFNTSFSDPAFFCV